MHTRHHHTAVRGTAVRGTAIRGTAIRGTAIRGTAVRGTAIRGTAVRGTAIRGRLHPRAGISVLATIALVAAFGLPAGCAGTMVRQTDLFAEYFDEPLSVGTPATAQYELIGTTHVLRLSGDEYGMGYQYGLTARDLGIARFYELIMANATQLLVDEVPDEFAGMVTEQLLLDLLGEAWQRMEPHTPAYVLRLLEGFAAGSGIDLALVHAVHAVPDFTETSCSALWATGSATVDGNSLQIRVLDYIMGLGIQQEPAVVFMEFADGTTVANIGWLGLLGVISGMNNRGLAVSEMGYGNPPGEHFHGIPMPFLLLDVLRFAQTPDQAAGIIRSRPRTNSYVYVVGSADHGALAFVTNAYTVDIVEPGDSGAVVPQLPDMVQAGHYQERMDALVAEHHGAVSVDWLQTSFIPQIAMRSNLQSVIYDLHNGRFFVANAPDGVQRAADQPYREFVF